MPSLETKPITPLSSLHGWFERNIISLGREMRLSYLPPLMIYMAAGVSGLTGIVGTFFVKDYLGLSAAFLASLGFWLYIPWALKMPLGHLVDLFWRWKSILVFIGAGLIATSLTIMIGLIAYTDWMRQYLTSETWYVISALLAPVGYVVQDVVADAMTVEAVPRVDDAGKPIAQHEQRLMHTTMQTLGRVAIIGGGVAVAVVNVVMFQDAASLPEEAQAAIYADIYRLALLIPLISVLGVSLGEFLKWREAQRLRVRGLDRQQIQARINVQTEKTEPDWWILGGSLMFALFTIVMGLADIPYNQEIIFAGSMAIVVFLIGKLSAALDDNARRILIGTALLVFMFRAIPGPGAGSTWFMIDELGFDQQFLSVLSLIASSLTLAGMFIFRRFMAEKSLVIIIAFLTIAGAVLTLPNIGLYYGVQEWTAAITGGVVDARFIALMDTALESPLGQIAMIPMLAWIANSAPNNLKATFFAVMASFTNLALSLSQLLTKYLNQIFIITRQVEEPAGGAITTPANYSELGVLLISVLVIGLLMPLLAILVVTFTPLKAVGSQADDQNHDE